MLTLVPVEDDRAGVVSRMLQLYAYDLSDVVLIERKECE